MPMGTSSKTPSAKSTPPARIDSLDVVTIARSSTSTFCASRFRVRSSSGITKTPNRSEHATTKRYEDVAASKLGVSSNTSDSARVAWATTTASFSARAVNT